MNLLATYGLGSFDPTSPEKLAQQREERYGHLFELADAYLSRGLSLWVDGNFPQRAWRSGVLGVARRHGVPEVAAIQCFCSMPARLEKRFLSRRTDPDQPDARADDISAYHGSVSQFEPLTPEELEGIPTWEILEYDSCRKRLGPRQHPTRLGSEIRRQMLACRFLIPA
jgi:hypothetical protein